MESDASSVQTMERIADGNVTMPMEVDALMEGKGKSKGKGKGKEGRRQRQREKQRKEQGQAKGRNIRHVECEVFLLQGKRPHRKGLP